MSGPEDKFNVYVPEPEEEEPPMSGWSLPTDEELERDEEEC